jgi:hypothetical protein
MQNKVFEEEKKGLDAWEKDMPEDDGEVIKMEVGQSIEGLLVDKFASIKYNTFVYKIKTKEGKLLIILGSTLLDKMMQTREIGEEIKITKLEDQTSQKGRTYQMYETFHKKKE